MKVGSLFSGIGGLDLGFEWAGFTPAFFCEIEPYPCQVLARHWPHVPIINDVRDVTRESVPPVDVIIGGFPCQDLSYAGKGAGLAYDLSTGEGTRSGLWWEMWRVIRDLRPQYAVMENVAALLGRGLDVVLGSLADIGYDAEWTVVPAASVGAPHIRERVIIVAYPSGGRQPGSGRHEYAVYPAPSADREAVEPFDGCGQDESDWDAGDVADANGQRRATRRAVSIGSGQLDGRGAAAIWGDVEYPEGEGLEGRGVWDGRIGFGQTGQPSWFGGTWTQPWPVSFRVDRDTDDGGEHPVGTVSAGVADPGSVRELERVALVGDVRRVADGISGGVVEEGVMWPTPRTITGGAESGQRKKELGRTESGGGDLQAAVLMWPTPTADLGQIDFSPKSAQRKRDGNPFRDSGARIGNTMKEDPRFLDLVGQQEPGSADWLYTDVPDRTARLKALGNAVVPQVAYLVAQAVRQHAEETGRWT